jgi:L-lactate dehydrogenase
MENRKIVIVGDGAVGSTIAYTLLLQDYVNEISIIDINKDKAEGDVLDMVHGLSFVSPKKVIAGTYDDVKNAHIIVITAGVNQKEGETRLDLLKRNIKVFNSIIDNIKPNLMPDAVVLVVTNPVDLLTLHTYKRLGISSNRVIGTGTVLDTSRLKFLISKEAGVDPRNVHALVIGEHGDSEVSAFSVSTIAGLPVEKYFEDKGEEFYEELHEKVRNAAYEIIKKKGATYYAIGLSTAKIIETIMNNQKSILTVSTYMQNEFNGMVNDVYLSLPAVVGSKGVERILHLEYSYSEVLKLIESSKKLLETLSSCTECNKA